MIYIKIVYQVGINKGKINSVTCATCRDLNTKIY